jgi:hypothetical protein
MACSRSFLGWLGVVLGVVAGSCATTRAARATERCVECHLGAAADELRLPAEQVPGSAHGADAIGCVGCHGGDPADATARAHATDFGFVGRPRGEQGVALCGQCHAEPSTMHRLGSELRTDQLALYRTSRHAELEAVGDPAAPDCVACHGSHDILPGSAPGAATGPARLSDMCGRCHADSARMAGFRTPTTVVAQWERSAHAGALRQNDPRAPSCTGCHGAHADAPTDAVSAARACAHCHEPEQQAVERGVHAKPFARQGLGECVPCHGAHEIQQSEPLLLGVGPDGACARCHPPGGPSRRAIEQLGDLVRAARDRAARARARAARLGSGRPAAPALKLAELDGLERTLGPMIHLLDPDALAALDARVEAGAAALERVLDRIERARRIERGASAATVALPVVLLVLLRWRARRAQRRASR